MPGFLLHLNAQVLCSHGGQATPSVANPRVKVMGNAIVMAAAPWTVAGCALPPPPAANGPCVTATWIPATAALRVRSLTQPVLLMDSQAICAPSGTPLMVMMAQARVKGM
jgi:hypothetical protein